MKTKSISLLLILALFVTIGGVYATWVFAETPLQSVHGHIGSFGLANASTNNGKGTITINAEGAHLTIDQKATNDYTANLVASGTISVTFNPSNTWMVTNQDVTEIVMQYNLKTDNAKPTEYLVADEDGNETINLFSKFDTTTKTDITLTKQADGSFTGSITAAALLDLVEISTFKIESYAHYEKVSGKVSTFGNIGVEISEKAAVAVTE